MKDPGMFAEGVLIERQEKSPEKQLFTKNVEKPAYKVEHCKPPLAGKLNIHKLSFYQLFVVIETGREKVGYCEKGDIVGDKPADKRGQDKAYKDDNKEEGQPEPAFFIHFMQAKACCKVGQGEAVAFNFVENKCKDKDNDKGDIEAAQVGDCKGEFIALHY